MPQPSGEKLCPICDSPLQPGSKKCSFCGTDLSIFEMDFEPPQKGPEPAPPTPPQKTTVEERVEEIISRAMSTTQESAVAEPVREEPVSETKAPEEAAPEVEYFECPQCGARVEATASVCPKCGVLFAEEGAEMFECPACKALVSIDATTCPGCGAIFVEAEEGGEAAAAPPSPAKEELEEPVAEVRPPATERPPEVRPAPPEVKAEEKKAPEKTERKGVKGLLGLLKLVKKTPASEGPKAAPSGPEKPTPAAEPAPPEPQPSAMRVLKEPREVAAPAPAAPAVPPSAPAPPPSAPPSAAKEKGRELARMVAEMKPLLALARDRDVDIGESKQLIDEAAEAGREKQLDRAIELVQRSKALLMKKIDEHLAQLIMRLNDDIRTAREFGGDVSRATTFIQEVARARSAGDVEAAYVYADKVSKELLPITGRYNESKKKLASLKEFIADCELFLVDTKEARRLYIDAQKALEVKDFDRLDSLVKSANESLNKAIPARMSELLKKAKDDLLEAKVRNVNISPMLTVLKSASNLMKSGDYAQALKEMREFREMLKKAM